MPVETPINGIWDLNINNPLTSDSRRQGDDHLRLIKDAVKKTFPSIAGVVNANATELNKLDGAIVTTAEINYLAGVTSNIQTQLNDPAIMRTDQNNVVTGGYIEIDENVLRVDRAVGTAAKQFIALRTATEVALHDFIVWPNNDPLRPEALAIRNASGISKFIVRQNALALELTSTNLEWGGAPLALQSYVDGLIATCAKNADFVQFDVTFNTVSTIGSFTLNTGFGTDDFSWGIGGIRRSDGSSVNMWATGADDNDFKQSMQIGTGLTEPTEPAAAIAGHINFSVYGAVSGTITWVMRVWARKNI